MDNHQRSADMKMMVKEQNQLKLDSRDMQIRKLNAEVNIHTYTLCVTYICVLTSPDSSLETDLISLEPMQANCFSVSSLLC